MMLGALAMPIAVGSFLLAPRIFGVMYGSGFDRGVLAYLLVTPLTPIRMLGNTLGTALTAADRQTPRTVAVGVAAGVNVVLNLILIPRWGLFGAVASTIVTETGLFTAYVLMLRRVIGPSCLVSAVAIPGMACVPMALSIVLLFDAPLAVILVAAGCVYTASLYAIAALMTPGRTNAPALRRERVREMGSDADGLIRSARSRRRVVLPALRRSGQTGTTSRAPTGLHPLQEGVALRRLRAGRVLQQMLYGPRASVGVEGSWIGADDADGIGAGEPP